MRTVAGIVALLLVAGCGQPSHESAGPSERVSSVPPKAGSTPPKAPITSVIAAAPPNETAPIGAVIAWVEAGMRVDPGGFHGATRDAVSTQLADGVAFTTPSGTTTCMLNIALFGEGRLACLAGLTNPPAQPADAVGHWIGGWIDYPGDTLTVGGLHGDPGQFGYGQGAELSYGQRLKVGDYQCRVERVGLYCVNYAHQTAARISDAGVVPFGCLREVDPPVDAGVKFSC